ncbi:thiamine-phosphate kinase [Rothia nasisuis]|uniref:thiamine-phosphate kinase n=1 Tax=Rothia nasisuis TaxID=2109647 RepID=UPI001F02D10A|nr:thiamine-phosphate kinase [Rothia nasisuis]
MTTVSQVSESELLAVFLPVLTAHNTRAESLRRVPADGALVVGPGDDSATLDLTGGLTVMSTDTQTENQDFRSVWPSGHTTGGYQVGWKLATQNLADIAAMGATPVALLVSLSLPPVTPVTWVQDFARGLVESTQHQGATTCTIAGGDLGRSAEISVTGTAVGLTRAPVTRDGAREGDAVVLAGALGAAAAGLALLETSGLRTMTESQLACIAAQQQPVSPLLLGQRAAGHLNALMDISDGLVRDATRLAAASHVRIDLHTRDLAPWVARVHETASLLTSTDKAESTALGWVLTGGEDHALMGTCDPTQIPTGFTKIGSVHAGSGVTVDGRAYTAKGWDHFEAGAR